VTQVEWHEVSELVMSTYGKCHVADLSFTETREQFFPAASPLC